MQTDFHAGEKIIKTHHCADCKTNTLIMPWDGQQNSYVVKCARCGGDNLKRNKSAKEQWLENPEGMPVHTANVMARKYKGDIEELVEGLPDELAQSVRERYLGVETKRRETQCPSEI